jgi:hypothetical protein
MNKTEVSHTFNFKTWVSEARGSQVWGWPSVYNDIKESWKKKGGVTGYALIAIFIILISYMRKLRR